MRLCVILLLLLLCIITYYFIYRKHSKEKKIVELISYAPVLKKKYSKIRNNLAESEPEILELEKLIDDFKISKNYNNIIKIGDFYRKGAYPRWRPNKVIAKKCYELVEHSSLDENLSTIAMCKYIEIMNCNIDHFDISGLEIPESYYHKIEELVNENDIQTYQYNEIMFRDENHIVPNVINTFDNNINQDIVNNLDNETINVFNNDLQNVHDHYLINITKTNIDKLKNNYKFDDCDIHQILTDALYRDNALSVDQRFKINEVLNTFNNKHHVSFGISEDDSLKYIYKFICSKSNKSDLLHNLLLQLEDCYENGIVVCPTGKISRVLSLASDSEEFDSNRNIYYIKDELESLASKVREDEIKKLTDAELLLYNNGDGAIADKMKQVYIDLVKEEYCNKLNINYDIVKPFIDINVTGF